MGEKEEQKLFELSEGMADAIFFHGGGDVYLEAFGRLCFCSGCKFGEHGPINKKIHSSTCDMLWKAWKVYEHSKINGQIVVKLPDDDLLADQGGRG